MRAKWFDPLGHCTWPGCKRPATGVLRDTHNAEIGKYCEPCARRRIQFETPVGEARRF